MPPPRLGRTLLLWTRRVQEENGSSSHYCFISFVIVCLFGIMALGFFYFTASQHPALFVVVVVVVVVVVGFV